MLWNRKYFELHDRLLVPNRSPSPGFWEMNDLLIHCLNKIYQNMTTFMQFNVIKADCKMSTVSMTLGALPLVERIFGGNLRVTACCDETEIKLTSEFEVPLGSMLAFQKTCWQRFLEVKLGLQTKIGRFYARFISDLQVQIFLIKLISKVDLRLKCQLICCLWVFTRSFDRNWLGPFFATWFRQLVSLVLDVGLKSYLFCYTYSWVKRIWCTVISQESDFARRFS